MAKMERYVLDSERCIKDRGEGKGFKWTIDQVHHRKCSLGAGGAMGAGEGVWGLTGALVWLIVNEGTKGIGKSLVKKCKCV